MDRRQPLPTCVRQLGGGMMTLADLSVAPEFSGILPQPQPIMVWASDRSTHQDEDVEGSSGQGDPGEGEPVQAAAEPGTEAERASRAAREERRAAAALDMQEGPLRRSVAVPRGDRTISLLLLA